MIKSIKARNFGFVLILVIGLIVALPFFLPQDEKIMWARELKTEDIIKIEAIQMPSQEHQRYKNYDASEFASVLKTINTARGNKVDNPEQLAGGALTFYVTLSDGTRHKYSNDANTYLVIDDVYFDAGDGWLESWGNTLMNDKTPDNFVY